MAAGNFVDQGSPQRAVFGAGTLAQLPEEVARLRKSSRPFEP
jgi:hypothetical protein